MKNKKIVNLEWYNKIRKLIKEGENLTGEEKLKAIPKGERDLYSLSRFDQELTYNWDEIEALLLKKDSNITRIPNGICEFFEVDNEGNPTGKYDWDYIMSVIESIIQPKNSELDIFKMWDSEYAEEIQEILDLMPDGVTYLLENINDSSELYEILAANTVENLDFPIQLRNNASAMLSLFKECDCFDLEKCWELLSDELKQNKQFLEGFFELDTVRENSSVLLKINPEIYKNDDEFKMKMLECDFCFLFRQLWDETKDLWDSVMARIDDDEFFKSCDNIEDFDYVEMENSEFIEKLYDEIDRRITLAMQEGRKLEYPFNGKKTEKIPLNYLRARLISRDRKNLGLDIQKCILRANGSKLKLPKEIAIYNTEIEDEEEDLTIVYGTDKQGRQNILYYYPYCPSPIFREFTRQQRILNNKGDVINMFRISAFEDGRVVDIDDIAFSYTYNEEGKKIYSLAEGWVTGTLYNEYDENEKIVKTTEIPTGITEQDCNIIATMKRAVGKTIGNTDNALAEINELMKNEIELEGEEKDDN